MVQPTTERAEKTFSTKLNRRLASNARTLSAMLTIFCASSVSLSMDIFA
uniref:Uncharacterized protein n=1 Tax=Arundo donax TaxID=35708 RepID=A0A0A9HDX0_ARUDO